MNIYNITTDCPECSGVMHVDDDGDGYKFVCAECGNEEPITQDDIDYWEENAEEYESDGESLNVWDAADIWASNGFDEDYMFGYTREELEDALN